MRPIEAQVDSSKAQLEMSSIQSGVSSDYQELTDEQLESIQGAGPGGHKVYIWREGDPIDDALKGV